jgi:hypothetical protein
MRYCLVKDGKAFEGDTCSELVSQATTYSLDYDRRTLFLDAFGGEDSVSYSKEYSDEEFRAEAAKRVFEILIKNGWRLYRGED